MEMKVKVINNKSEGDYITKVKVKVEMILRWKWKRQWLYNGSKNGYTMKAKVAAVIPWKCKGMWKWKWLYAESGNESDSDYTMKGEVTLIIQLTWRCLHNKRTSDYTRTVKVAETAQ